jgi:hypothetical protein
LIFNSILIPSFLHKDVTQAAKAEERNPPPPLGGGEIRRREERPRIERLLLEKQLEGLE